MYSGIRDLSIAQRSRWRDKDQRIAAYTENVQALQESQVIYAKRAKDSVTRLKDWVVL